MADGRGRRHSFAEVSPRLKTSEKEECHCFGRVRQTDWRGPAVSNLQVEKAHLKAILAAYLASVTTKIAFNNLHYAVN